jgi:hypothetical protein
MLQALLGTSFGVFFGITVLLTGFTAFMTGQAVANTWKPYWQVPAYCAMLGCVARFLIYGLFDGELWSLSGYIAGTAVLILIGTFAFRVTRARKMVCQYPWIFRRSGLFGWAPRHETAEADDIGRP